MILNQSPNRKRHLRVILLPKPVATTTTPTVGLFGEQTWLLKYSPRVFVQNCRPKNSIVIHDSCDQKHLKPKNGGTCQKEWGD